MNLTKIHFYALSSKKQRFSFNVDFFNNKMTTNNPFFYPTVHHKSMEDLSIYISHSLPCINHKYNILSELNINYSYSQIHSFYTDLSNKNSEIQEYLFENKLKPFDSSFPITKIFQNHNHWMETFIKITEKYKNTETESQDIINSMLNFVKNECKDNNLILID